MPDQEKLLLDKVDLGDGQTLDIGHYLTHSYDDVSEASQELPAMLEWVHTRLQVVYEKRLILKAELEEAMAKAWFDLQGHGAGSFAENFHGKPTAEAINHAVNLDQHVCKLKRTLAVYTAWTQRLNNLQSSIQAKLDLVRSTEATRRTVFDETPGTD
jgi:hypothetical protein